MTASRCASASSAGESLTSSSTPTRRPDPETGRGASPAPGSMPPGGGEGATLFAGRIALRRGASLRSLAARGVMVNAAFQVGLATLGMLKGLVVAAFLSPSEYGVWGILLISLMTMLWLKEVGVGDKFVQQSEEDQELAFRSALTLELVLSSAFALLFALVLPVYALVYGQPKIVAPGLVLALMPVLASFQAPAWIFW